MGLSIEVGILAGLNENDPEGAEHFRAEFDCVNRFLATQSIPAHRESETCEVWSCGMYGYSGLHYLRRIAAHLDIEGKLAPPGGDKAEKDPVLQRYYDAFGRPQGGFLGRWFKSAPIQRCFDHLIIHSDAEGYYIPQDFPSVLIPGPAFPIAGGMLGSSQRLLAECQRLAEALSLPLDIDPESEELWEATKSQGKGDLKWQRYGVESFTCLRLYRAAQHSIQNNAAIVFT
ncbi:MAG: hypothetical protein AB1705_12240 [Verrucomicrobiota bacterium]